MKNKKSLIYILPFIFLSSFRCGRDQPYPPKYETILEYDLSDTTGVIKVGDTLAINIQIPNPLITVTGERVPYYSIEHLRIGFSSFVIGNPTICMQPAYRLLTSKGFSNACAPQYDFDWSNRAFHVLFIPNDTGWYVLDCQNNSNMTLKYDKDEFGVSVQYRFKGKRMLDELNRQYPCNKPLSDLRDSSGVGYYGFKVVK